MKIHIVQKGDTLWEIAREYGVDFEELKQMNTQLSSPDMIMPGMKIRIPSEKKKVQDKSKADKKEKQVKEQSYKDISPKPLQTIKEDDHVKETKVKAAMPKMPTTPTMPKQQKMPQLPPMPKVPTMPKMEMEEKVQPKEPVPKEKPQIKTEEKKPIQKKETHYEQVMVPVCCHVFHSCCQCQHMHHHHPIKGQMASGCQCHSTKNHMHQPSMWHMRNDDAPINQYQGSFQPAIQPTYPINQMQYEPQFIPNQNMEQMAEQPNQQVRETTNQSYPMPPYFQPYTAAPRPDYKGKND